MVQCCDIEDYYKEGEFLRRWELIDGFPRCTVDALPIASLDPEDVSNQEVANATVREALQDLEAYEAALTLASQDEPVRLITLIDGDGQQSTMTNPDWTAWHAAKLAVQDVSAATLALHDLRGQQ
ncbi:hypothetical protein [Thalassospira marina]|uniref:Uncharacterized protein n=1 Tax=Thalassospira marina TaxID=2048283 RepID=A0A2N3KY97_9PROT|nr:hypothetical protein [Thalassospira marina]PKR55467.1 hypothetical protein COO20_04675 [Thalassospira marina]